MEHEILTDEEIIIVAQAMREADDRREQLKFYIRWATLLAAGTNALFGLLNAKMSLSSSATTRELAPP